MEYSKQNVSNYYLYDTQVENLFLSEYMASAPGEFVKAYLVAAMYAQFNMPADDRIVAKAAGVDPEKMAECWAYWESRGVVRRVYTDPEGGAYDIELVNLREEVFGSRAPSAEPKAVARMDDKALARLYRDIEASAGRMLEAREPEEVASWLSEYAMTPEFILCGYKFCAAKRRSTKCRYVGTVLKDWKSKGLSSPAQVEEYLQGIDRHYDLYRQIFRELGFTRSATEEEKRIMNKWFDDYGFDLNKIKEACGRTAGISNPNINYVDAVLTAWHKESGRTPETEAELLTVRIEKLYEKDRQENAARTEAIRRKIYAKIPRMEQIQEDLRTCRFNISRYMLMGGPGKEAAAEQRAKIESLRREKSLLLKQAGYSESALDTAYTCKQCRDTGFLEDGSRCPCYKDKMRLLMNQEG
ncbi:MAG: DnaD domain protein [Firmicutes bacterium]|nr:DnaD domain protein [Bacillota bacterium]